MRIRPFKAEDQARIAEIHGEMGLDYLMPDLSSDLVKVCSVVEHDGEIVGAVAGKIQPEIYLWLAPGQHPAAKWDAIRLMQRDLIQQAVKLGFEQLVCYVPECVGKFFAKRMLRLHWNPIRDGWKPWCYELRAK